MFNRAILLWLVLAAPPAFAETYLCSGTDPDWSLELEQTTALFSAPDRTTTRYDVPLITQAEARDWPRAYTLVSRDATAIAVLRAQTCINPGVDREFGTTLDILTQSGVTPVILTGCCRLKPAQR